MYSRGKTVAVCSGMPRVQSDRPTPTKSPRTRRTEAPIAEKREAGARAWASNSPLLKTNHHLILGDARELREVKPPIHLVVTSPPYWDLKTYDGAAGDRQLGHIHSREHFLDELDKVWTRCLELLVPGGRLCVVVGDVCRSRRLFGRHLVDPLHAYIQVRCQALGFDPLAPILWNKIANAATEVVGNGSPFLGKPYEPNAIIKNDTEYILIFRKPGGYRHPTQEQRDLSIIGKDEHRRWFQQVWSDIPGDLQRHHPAPFPVEIAKRLVGMFSFVGDTILDPFVGLGSTMLAAAEMHRLSIGVEIEPKYFDLAEQRIIKHLPTGATLEHPKNGGVV